jgi:succinoglycan biosynthesis protein ExoA
MASEEKTGLLVVIPCLNEEFYLENLIREVMKNSHDLSPRIVIADGGSRDRTADIARQMAAQYPNVIYLHNQKRIQSAAVNLAAEVHGKEADFLIRLDAHADYPADYCRTLLSEARETGAASVVVSMQAKGKSGFQIAAAAAQNSKLGNGGSAHRNAAAGAWTDHGHHALMRMDAFRTLGGYDDRFSHNEDAEFDIRLANRGDRIWLTGKTSVIYFPRAMPLALFRQYYNFGRGRARTIIKHRIIPKLRQMIPAGVLPAAFLALLAPLSKLFAVPFLAWVFICLAYGALLGIRARNATTAMSGTAILLMHSGWSLGFWVENLKNIYALIL